MSSLDIAPHPEGAPTRVRDRRRMRHRFRVSSRRAGICTSWRLGFRQFSFHRIARVPRRTVPDTWTQPPVFCHALVPLTFRRQVRHRTQGHPSNPSRLRRGYNEAPRGAPRSCRDERRSGPLTALVDFYRGRGCRLQYGCRPRGWVNPPWAGTCVTFGSSSPAGSSFSRCGAKHPQEDRGLSANRTVLPVAVMLGAATMCLYLVRAGGADEGPWACRSPEHRCRRC
jgi:hypothetical protein